MSAALIKATLAELRDEYQQPHDLPWIVAYSAGKVTHGPCGQHVSFTCPRCGRRSYNPNDAAHCYCGACNEYSVGVPAFVYRWLGPADDDPVMVFDGAGEQLTELQGEYQAVRTKLLAAAQDATAFFHGRWRLGATRVGRPEW